MISIDEAYVDAAAPNAEAGKNGRGLVLKNKFTELHIAADETVLFGACIHTSRSLSCSWNPIVYWIERRPSPDMVTAVLPSYRTS